MDKVSKKFKRALALMLSFVMVVSVISVTPSATAEAASKKVIKSLSVAKTATVNVGSSKNVKATVKTTKSVAKGDLKVTVKSSNKSVVTAKVSKSPSKKGKSGQSTVKLTGKKAGTATVTVTTKATNKKNKKVSKKIKVTVKGNSNSTSDNKTVSKVSVSVAKTELNVGDSEVAVATVEPTGVSTNITWSSSNTSVATVDSQGRVLALAAGSVVITATASNGVSGNVTIVVKAVSVTGVALDHHEVTLAEGSSTTLVPTITPSNATVRTFTFTSSDNEVAKVDANGKVEALKEGTAVITVTTTDGAFTDKATITVTKDTSKDVDGLEVYVSNALDGYTDTVLVGTPAYVHIKATSGGAPYSGLVSLSINSSKSTGYSGYYTLTSGNGSPSKMISVKTDSNGIADIMVTLGENYTGKGPKIEDWAEDLAYASVYVDLEAGGAGLESSIPVNFAQVDEETLSSYENYVSQNCAITVENQYDATLNPIINSDNSINTSMTIGVTTNKDGLAEEYVIDQQQSDATLDNGDHKVVLDAAPLLIRASAYGSSNSSDYEKTFSGQEGTISEYSVYSDEDESVVLSGVPGGLQYLALTFSKLKLSKYSRVAIQAYYSDTNIPIVGAVDYIDANKSLGNGNTYNVDKTIFNEQTQDMEKIDIKIYVESYGQVCEDDNIGFVLTKAEGPWNQNIYQPRTADRLTDAVTWKLGQIRGYNVDDTMEAADAAEVMGDKYKSNATYKINYPSFPETGNAIITETVSGKETYYMCPTKNVSNNNVLVNNPSAHVFKISYQQKEELSSGYTAKIDESGRYVIDTEGVGYIPVQATINVANNEKLNYTVNSSIQWSPIPEESYVVPEDFYALSGQSVTLKAKVVSKNTGSVKSGIEVDWELPEGATYDANAENVNETDSYGIATLTLTSQTAQDLNNISVTTVSGYETTLMVADKEVKRGYANVHWVMPGIYYQPSEDVDAIVTSDSKYTVSPVEVEQDASYISGSTWIVGTKAVGTLADETQVAEISGIGIQLQPQSAGLNVDIASVGGNASGVCKVTTTGIGSYSITATIDPKTGVGNKITLENGEVYDNVGTGDINGAKALKIGINWNPNGANLSILDTNQHTYDIAHQYLSGEDDNYIEEYIQVLDKNENPVKDTVVTYSVKDANGVAIVSSDDDTKTDLKGLVVVRIPVPNVAADYTLSANIAGADTSSIKTVSFVSTQETFNLNSTSIDTTKGTITLTFNQAVNSNIVTDAKFYTVMAGETELSIESVEVSKNNAAEVVLTISQTSLFAANTVITIAPSYKDDSGVTHFYIDKTGNLYDGVAAADE